MTTITHQDGEMTRLCREAQDIEELAWWDIYSAAPEAYARQHELRATRLPGGTCFAHRHLLTWDFNRVLKLGTSSPTTEPLLNEVQAWMVRNASPAYAIGVDPNTQPELVSKWLQATGLNKDDGGMTRFFHDGPERAVDIKSTLNVREIQPHEGDLFGALVRTAFDLAEGFDTWFGQLAGRPGWRIFIACNGAEPVATGAMYLNEGRAWLGLGATLKDHRRRGAQSLLLNLRVSEAKKMGINSIHIETENPAPGAQRDSSYRNILKAGFKVLFVRDHYMAASPTD